MSEGENQVRAALAASVAINREEVKLAGETITLIRSEIRMAVREGIKEAIDGLTTEERAREFWMVGLRTFQEQAKISTGKMVLDGVWVGVKKIFWIAVFVSLFWSFFGWSGAMGVLKAIKAGSS